MSTPPSNTTCAPGGGLPSFPNLAIPSNLTTFFTPHTNTSDAPMTACCAPNPVHVSLGCYEWCEVPGSRLHNSSKDDIYADMGSCLAKEGWNSTQSGIVGVHVANSGAGGWRFGGVREGWGLMVVVGLGVVGFVLGG
ncbi:hypothetical protein QBC47DRAFT_403199 [Echria macrotheca]|uniref:Uncharacterized protein n=1 Tax=Echria macrotheca TaxID=438768 RepID=A0AAJ0BAP5_9PEZI|nr:hypothetical protein QBC47DRAFT_403199 [Echria macrotheca]